MFRVEIVEKKTNRAHLVERLPHGLHRHVVLALVHRVRLQVRLQLFSLIEK